MVAICIVGARNGTVDASAGSHGLQLSFLIQVIRGSGMARYVSKDALGQYRGDLCHSLQTGRSRSCPKASSGYISGPEDKPLEFRRLLTEYKSAQPKMANQLRLSVVLGCSSIAPRLRVPTAPRRQPLHKERPEQRQGTRYNFTFAHLGRRRACLRRFDIMLQMAVVCLEQLPDPCLFGGRDPSRHGFPHD